MNTHNAKTSTTVPITILLAKQHRNASGLAKLIEIVTELGMVVTSSGRTAICCNMTRPMFQKLFGKTPIEVEAKQQGNSDFGSNAGFASEDLPIPTALKNIVDVISVEPPSIRMDGQ